MRAAFRLILTLFFCLGLAAGVVVWATGGMGWWRHDRSTDRGALPVELVW